MQPNVMLKLFRNWIFRGITPGAHVLLCRMSSCGVPYLINLVPRVETDSEDAWLRVPWYRMKYDRFRFFRTAGRDRE